MKNMYTWAARPVRRNLTVADMRAAKGERKLVQVTANSQEEASAATAGIDLIIGVAVPADRRVDIETPREPSLLRSRH